MKQKELQRLIDSYTIKNIIEELKIKTISPKYIFLFYDQPTYFAEIGYIDKKGNISEYKPASILLLRNLLNNLNEFTGSNSNLKFKGLIPDNVIYYSNTIESKIIYFENFKDVTLQFSNKEYMFESLKVMFFVKEDKIMAYRYDRYNKEDTKLYPLNLPNVFSTYICIGNTGYQFTNYETWEEVIEETNKFFLHTKFTSDINDEIIKYYSNKPESKERWKLKEILEKFIS